MGILGLSLDHAGPRGRSWDCPLIMLASRGILGLSMDHPGRSGGSWDCPQIILARGVYPGIILASCIPAACKQPRILRYILVYWGLLKKVHGVTGHEWRYLLASKRTSSTEFMEGTKESENVGRELNSLCGGQDSPVSWKKR